MRKLLGLAAILLFPLPATPRRDDPRQERDGLYLNEAPSRYVRKLDESAKALDWKSVFDLYDLACERYQDRVVRLSNEAGRAVGFAEYARLRVLSAPGGREAFRSRYDGAAAAAFAAARRRFDVPAMERALERFFLSTGADEAADWLANRLFEEGAIADAARLWRRAIDRLEGTEAIYPILVTRLGTALALLGDTAGLTGLRSRVRTEGLVAKVRVANQVRPVEEYLTNLRPRSAEIGGRPERPEPTWDPRPSDRDLSPSSEMIVGTYNLQEDGPPLTPLMVTTRGEVANRSGRDYLLVTTGRRLIALDPCGSEGRPLEKSVYWKHPSVPVRGARTQVQARHPVVYGCAVSEDIVVGTFLGKDPKPAAGRQFALDGASSVKAFELRTGRLLWDTEELTTEVRNKRVPILEGLSFGDRDFMFTAAPIIWHGCIYLPVATNPSGERECHLVCLDLQTGRPIWSTFLVAGAPGRAGHLPMTTLAIDGGMVYVATGLGAVAGMDAVTGEIRWISSYTSRQAARSTGASAPVVHGSLVYVVPQDGYELVAFDRSTGVREPLQWPRDGGTSVNWNSVSYLAAFDRGWIVLGGSDSYWLDLSTLRAYDLHSAGPARPTPGTFTRGRLVLPWAEGFVIFDSESRKRLTTQMLSQGGRSGDSIDVIVGGEYLVTQGRTLAVYTSVAALLRRFEPLTRQSPPRLDSCYQLANLFFTNGRWQLAAPFYQTFIEHAAGDPKWSGELKVARDNLSKIPRPRDYR